MDRYHFKQYVTSLVQSDNHKILAFSNFESTYENIDCMSDYFLKHKFTNKNENIFSFDLRGSDFQTNFDDLKEKIEKNGKEGIYLFSFISRAKPSDKEKVYKLLIELSKKKYVKNLVIIDFVDEVKEVFARLPEVTPIALDCEIIQDIYSS
jgi:hypothetical protein